MSDHIEQPPTEPTQETPDNEPISPVEEFYQYFQSNRPQLSKYALIEQLSNIRNALAYDIVASHTHRERNIHNRQIVRDLNNIIERINSAKLIDSEIPF